MPDCNVQMMVRHKSRLEREKEAAAAAKEGGGLPCSTGQTRQRRSPAGSSFAGQVCQDIPVIPALTDVIVQRCFGLGMESCR